MKFNTFYTNRPKPVAVLPDTETKLVDQSEADRASLKYQLERYGMDSLQQQLQKTIGQFGYADTRFTGSYADMQAKYAEANNYFMSLPANVRKQYDHNASNFYAEIEKNPEQMFKKGFISKKLATDLGVSIKTDFSLEVPKKDVTSVTPSGPVVTPTVEPITGNVSA